MTRSFHFPFLHKAWLRRARHFVFLFILLLGAPAWAQSGRLLSGQIVDAATGAPVPFASLAVPGTPLGSVANAEGAFRLRLPAGQRPDTVLVQALGFAPLKLAVGTDAGRAPLTLRLQPRSYQLQEATIIAFSPTALRRTAPGTAPGTAPREAAIARLTPPQP